MRYIDGEALRQGGLLLPTDVERELVDTVEQIERGTTLLAQHVEQLQQVATDYELANAKAVHMSKATSADRRKAEALLATEDLYREKCLLETKVRLIRDTQHDLRASLEAIRSIGASVRSSMFSEGQGVGGGGGRPSGARP